MQMFTQVPRAGEGAPAQPRALSSGSETVLLVEDEQVVRSLVGRILRANGYKVLEATSGAEALELVQCYRDGPIHLVLTDMVMPEMGGQSLVGYLTRWFPEMCVLYMSGYASSEVVSRQGMGKPAAFIQKPFAPADLALKVRTILDQAGGDVN